MRDSALAISSIAPRLERLIRLLGSDKDGEVLGAARAIGRTLKQAGADFHDLAAALTRAEFSDSIESSEPVSWRDIPASERPAWLARMSASRRLSPWEQNFSASILAQAKFRPWQRLSPKQVGILDRCISKISEARR